MSKYRAFSMIELSIVIIIIGLIIGGIVVSQKMVSLSRITNARTLTNSSPINVTENLVLWLETVSKSSFNKNEKVSGTTISTWYDINNQHIPKYDFTASQSPIYTEQSINGLPAIVFSGGDDRLESSISIFNPATNDFTIFAVADFDITGHHSLITVANGSQGTLLGYFFTKKNIITRSFNGFAVEGPVIDESKAQIYRLTHDVDNSRFVFSINSGTEVQRTGNTTSGTDVWRIGSANNLNEDFLGSIGEIIVFDRTLTTFEIDRIEEYLSKKWKISLD